MQKVHSNGHPRTAMMSYETASASQRAAPGVPAEVVLVLRGHVGRWDDVEIRDERAVRFLLDRPVCLHPAALQIRVALTEAHAVVELIEHILTLAQTDDVGMLEAFRRTSLRVDATPDDHRVDGRLDAVTQAGGELIVRRPHGHGDDIWPEPLDQLDHHVLFLRRWYRVGEVVLEEDRVDFVAATFEKRMEDA